MSDLIGTLHTVNKAFDFVDSFLCALFRG